MVHNKTTEGLGKLTGEIVQAYSNALDGAGLTQAEQSERLQEVQRMMVEVRNAGEACLASSNPRIMEGTKLRVIHLMPGTRT